MTTVNKDTIAADVTALADGQTADAGDPKGPILDLETYVKAGRIGATDAATHVGSLNDILKVTAPVVKTVNNPSGDADITLSVSNMVGADGVSPGAAGLVPTPAASDNTNYLRGDGTWNALPGTGTVTSIDVTPPSGILTASGGPVTSSGAISLGAASKAANLVAAGPASGGAAAWDFRALVPDDLPQLPMDVLIPLTTLGSSASAIDLGSVGVPFSSNYNHLLIYLLLRSDVVSTADVAYMEINGDTAAANYQTAFTHHNGTSHGYSKEVPGTTAGIYLAFPVGANAPTSAFSPIWIYLPNYKDTNNHKSIKTSCIARLGTTDLYLQSGSGMWLSTNAIEYVSITPSTGPNWVANSQYAVYGIGS